MKALSYLFNNENCVEATHKLLLILNVKITKATLERDLFNHPDYPSLLSISDVIVGYGVENISIKTTADKLSDVPAPFIVSIITENNNNLFAVIESVNDNTVSYYHPVKYQHLSISKENFEKMWPSGVALLADAEEARGEKDYSVKLREEKRLNAAKYATVLALPLFTIIACVSVFFQYSSASVLPVFFTLVTLIGCVLGAILIWYELDQYNPILQQICSLNKKVNCSAVLKSKAAKIAGISWSVIGFTYFIGGLFTLLFAGITNVYALFILGWLNVLAIPFVFFSVYYQWRIAKQWCVLCLGVQAVLVLQLATSLAAKWHTAPAIHLALGTEVIIPILLAYVIPFIAVSIIVPAYRLAKESRKNKTELQRLKHNPQLFEALLAKQKAITDSTEGLGITLGNAHGTHKIIKVCNPYCGPCAKVHKLIEELLHNNPNLQVQILFTATNNEGDIKAPPVRHLLAIAENGETIARKALDDWYLADDKDYDAFAAKYPINDELKQQDSKVAKMAEWCDKTQIEFTPTFFINGYQLPEIYSVSDLKYFLSV